KGKEQIPKFVANKAIMLMDWPFHIDPVELEAKEATAAKAGKPDEIRAAVANLFDRIQMEVLGYYREPDGRIGAAQLLTIREFEEFLAEVNKIINLALGKQKQAELAAARREAKMLHTLTKIFTVAEAGHAWLDADGHALRGTVPVDIDEWAELKRSSVTEMLAEFVRVVEGGDPKKRDDWARFLKTASTWPFSYAERGDKVVFTLGNPTVVRTLHVSIREEYEPSLEKVVTEHAKVDLDTSLRRLLVDGEAPGNASLVKILPWLPKTAEVSALLAATRVPVDLRSEQAVAARAERDRAIKALRTWGLRWNARGGYPPAPPETTSQEEYLKAWQRDWYLRRKHASTGVGN
ncbi:MAG: hypothetical protein ACYTGW_11195, partial [Planctomycetota bacterium]